MQEQDLPLIVPTLNPQQVSVLVRSVLGLKTEEQRGDIATLDCLKAGIWEFMVAVGFVSDAQGREVLKRIDPALRDVLTILEAKNLVLPAFRLTFAEQRWATWPMQEKWYDITYDEEVELLPYPAVLYVLCDVTAMYLRQREKREKHNAESQYHGHVDYNRATKPD